MESDGESVEEALARVQRCTGGGASAEASDCDNELVFVAESHVINLRCPVSTLLWLVLQFLVRQIIFRIS